MAIFEYRGRTAQGDLVTGRLEADSMDAIASQLMNTGVTPIEIKETAADRRESVSLRRLLGGDWPSIDEMVLFTRQMYSLTKSGVPLIRGLLGLAETVRNDKLRDALHDIVENLEAGRTLSMGMARHPKIFNSLYVNIVKVGEETGRMEEAFQRLYQYIDLEKETRKQIKSALRYPLIVITAIIIAIAVITIWVIPEFARIFTSFDLELPWATKVILAISGFANAYWPIVLLMVIGATVGFLYWKRTEEGRYIWDRSKLKFPIIGDIIRRGTLARFSRAFAMSYRSGVPLIQTMNLCGRAVENRFLEARIAEMRDGIERGESVSRTAMTANMFTPLVLQMIRVGEETGALDDMLDEVAGFYEGEVEYDVKNLATLIEPILTVGIGVMVLILALGVFLPMWDLVQIAR